jgi:hypothetical protein
MVTKLLNLRSVWISCPDRWFIDRDREDCSRKILQLHHAGKLRLIAVTSDRRSRGVTMSA